MVTIYGDFFIFQSKQMALIVGNSCNALATADIDGKYDASLQPHGSKGRQKIIQERFGFLRCEGQCATEHTQIRQLLTNNFETGISEMLRTVKFPRLRLPCSKSL